MITKIFMFQFVNSYASFFYLAFIAESLGDCPDSGCMSTLTVNLAIIFGTRLFVGNFMELLVPYASYWYKYREETKRAGNSEMSQPEKEYLLDKVGDVLWCILLCCVCCMCCVESVTGEFVVGRYMSERRWEESNGFSPSALSFHFL